MRSCNNTPGPRPTRRRSPGRPGLTPAWRWHRALAAGVLLLGLLLPPALPAATNAPVPVPILHGSLKAASDAAALDQSLVLLVFSAEWCGPCKQLQAKTLDSKEFKEQGGALHLVDVDVDAESNLARDYGIEAVPTLVLLTAEAKIVGRRSGFLETAALLLWLHEARAQVKEGKWEGTAPGSRLKPFLNKAAADLLDTNDLARLIEFLGEPNPADREAAARLLVSQREPAMEPLIGAVTNAYLGVRIAAVEALRQLAPESPPVDPWQAPAELAGSAAALSQWWTSRGKLPPPSPAGGDPAGAASIAGALESLRSAEPGRRTKAMSALVAHGNGALPAVRAAVQSSEKAGDQRTLTLLEDVRWAILIPDDLDARAGARAALARGKGPERQAAALRLGRAGRDAIPALAELVEDADPLVVESAVRALSEIGGKDALPAMAALLKAADSNLRMTAAQALGHSKNPLAIERLVGVFDDPNEIVACTALSAVEEIQAERRQSSNQRNVAPEVVEGLKRCLADSRWRVRATAAEIAGKLGAKEVVEALKPLTADADGFVVKNTLEALEKLGAAPEPTGLQRVVERHPGLRGDVVALLVKWGTEESVQTVQAMYQAGNPDVRLTILDNLGKEPGRNPEATIWEPLLKQAVSESDPRLRRSAAEVLGACPPKAAAALVGPLLADPDGETRAKAAGTVLGIITRERTFRASSHAYSLDEFDLSDQFVTSYSVSGTRTRVKTNEPPATAAQIDAWHAALEQHAGATPDPVTAAALFVTGDTNAGLPRLQQALAAADAEGLAKLSRSTAPAGLLPRLPWPAAQPVVARLCAHPGLFLRMLAYTHKAAPGLSDYLLEPGRFCAAVEPASTEQLALSLPRYLNPSQKGFSLMAAKDQVEPIVQKLLTCTNAAWRAAALHCLASREGDAVRPVLERSLNDPNKWVRVTAVRGLARVSKARPALEQALAPLLADPDPEVKAWVATALLEPETRTMAELDFAFNFFQFEGIHAYSDSSSRSSSDRPLAPLTERPAFLEGVRQRLDPTQDNALTLSLLLAQYGDFTGLDRYLAAGPAQAPESAGSGMLAAMIALSRDAKYLPQLRRLAAAAKDEQTLRRLLQALKGMTGPEVRELRVEINRRMRQNSE